MHTHHGAGQALLIERSIFRCHLVRINDRSSLLKRGGGSKKECTPTYRPASSMGQCTAIVAHVGLCQSLEVVRCQMGRARVTDSNQLPQILVNLGPSHALTMATRTFGGHDWYRAYYRFATTSRLKQRAKCSKYAHLLTLRPYSIQPQATSKSGARLPQRHLRERLMGHSNDSPPLQ